MKRSIAWRLAALFALAALAVFSLIGAALDNVFDRELDQHQLEQLNTKFQDIDYILRRIRQPEQWDRVHAKLDALTPPDQSTRYWIWSDDAKVRYGKSMAGITQINPGTTGLGEIMFEHSRYPMKTRSAYFEATADAPAFRFMVGIDSAPYVHTKHAFERWLLALSALGVVLVTMLGYWTTQLGLKPLKTMSGEAEALSPSRLAQRLHVSTLPRELSTLGASFNGALGRLEAAYTQLENFNADVTHELRTPLANLIGQTQVALSRERSAEELEEVLQSNLEELERMRSIVADMLFLARADQGERPTRLAAASLAAEVNKTVEFLDFVTDEAGVRVRVQGDAEAPIETSLFRRAVTNLLANAIRHSQPDSEIVVEVSGTPDAARVAVSNPGPGIPAEHIGRLFDRFYRIDASRANSWENHGLGLAIVKAVATMHAGTVFASSENGITTVGFSVAAPVAIAPA